MGIPLISENVTLNLLWARSLTARLRFRPENLPNLIPSNSQPARAAAPARLASSSWCPVCRYYPGFDEEPEQVDKSPQGEEERIIENW